jgi:hypothetical protein
MTVKIQVEGQSFGDIQESIAIIAQAFNVRVLPSIDESMRKTDMQTVVETFKALMAEQGIDVQLEALVDPQSDEANVINIDKKQRRAKQAPTSVLTDDGDNDEELKANCIKKIKTVYFLPGGEEIVEGILRKHGGGAKSFQDVPANKFQAISDELDKSGN